jgi:hypothetical protein
MSVPGAAAEAAGLDTEYNNDIQHIPPGQWIGAPDENGIVAGEEFYNPE